MAFLELFLCVLDLIARFDFRFYVYVLVIAFISFLVFVSCLLLLISRNRFKIQNLFHPNRCPSFYEESIHKSLGKRPGNHLPVIFDIVVRNQASNSFPKKFLEKFPYFDIRNIYYTSIPYQILAPLPGICVSILSFGFVDRDLEILSS